MKSLIVVLSFMSAISTAALAEKSICVNDPVYEPHYGPCRVAEVYEDGTLKINCGNYGSQFRDSQSLGKAVKCQGGICYDNRVFDSYYGPGIVKEVYSDGMTQIEFNSNGYGSRYRSISALSKEVQCRDKVCKGDRVYDDSLSGPGTVEIVYDNGMAKVDFGQDLIDFHSENYGSQTRYIAHLSKEVDCRDTICKANRVYDSYYGWGTVREVYNNGRALIDFDISGAGSQFRYTTDLSKVGRP